MVMPIVADEIVVNLILSASMTIWMVKKERTV